MSLPRSGSQRRWSDEAGSAPRVCGVQPAWLSASGRKLECRDVGRLENSLWDAKRQCPAPLEGRFSSDFSKFRRGVCSSRGRGREVGLFSEQLFCARLPTSSLDRQHRAMSRHFSAGRTGVQFLNLLVVGFAIWESLFISYVVYIISSHAK